MTTITTLQPAQIMQAADLFRSNYQRLRAHIPLLPDTFEHQKAAAEKIASISSHSPVAAAFLGKRLIGFLGAWMVNDFRGTGRKAAYSPEWAHAAAADLSDSQVKAVYRALYRAAAQHWFEENCAVHAISLLPTDAAALQTWFWNGFGLTVVDAVRALEPIRVACPFGYDLRKASLGEVEALADIEAEHWQHYERSPVFMTPPPPDDATAFAQFVRETKNAAWIAWKGTEAAGYIRFEGSSFGAADIVNDEGTIAITGAYVRSAHRAQGLAAALLDKALADLTRQGYKRCSVDFESFNPEAAAFWMKYFEPACLSLTRVPERSPVSA